MKLSEAKINQSYQILTLNGIKNANHLINMGMYEGAMLHIKSKGLGTIIICIDGARYGLGNDIAKHICVSEVK